MKKVYLQEVIQGNLKCYSGVLPAKDLVKLATTKEFNTPQEAQRPIDLKRVEEIAEFVSTGGTLSTSIVIGTCDKNKLVVHPVDNSNINGLYYMEFPETKEEFEEYKNTFDIMDGQHRLFSFLPDRIKLDDSTTFHISFEMYITPTLRERQLIFKNTNEKQKSVASNLLLWFRQQLGMLSEKEKLYHPVVDLLNSESCSPLKGRIIMGAEKITGGLKAEQIIAILDKSKIKYISGAELDDTKMLTLISEYLSGWEDAVGSKIADRDKNFGPLSKISGFRFMILMLPAFYDKARNDRSPITKNYISNLLKELFSQYGLEPADLFNQDSSYIKELGINPFSGETPITLLATDWSNKLKSYSAEAFDPLAF